MNKNTLIIKFYVDIYELHDKLIIVFSNIRGVDINNFPLEEVAWRKCKKK